MWSSLLPLTKINPFGNDKPSGAFRPPVALPPPTRPLSWVDWGNSATMRWKFASAFCLATIEPDSEREVSASLNVTPCRIPDHEMAWCDGSQR